MPLSRSLLSRRISNSFRFHQGETTTAPESESIPPPSNMAGSSSWSAMLPELLGEIIRRVEETEDRWPQRRDVVTCACVSKKWREITHDFARSSLNSGKITFPSCLKLPGPRDFSNQCLIKRNKKTSTFYLYLALTPSFTDKGKFLLAARRFRTGAYTEYIISLDADDFSQGSNAYVGKLRSDFLGTNFTVYDSQPPHNGAKPSNGKASRRFASKQISPQVPAGNFEVGHVSYKFNLLKSRGPRRMVSTLRCPSPSPSSSSAGLSSDQKPCDVTKIMKKPNKDGSSLTVKLFDEMVKKKVKPTGVTFGTLIHGLCKDSRVKEALKMKHDMLKVYGVRPTVHIYASLIKALCQIGELSFAFKLKDEAYEGKIKVDAAIYSTLISSLIKAGRSNEVSMILEEMSEKGCKPDTVTYNVLINGFCVENDSESANRVLDEMVEKGLKPDVISYNMILGVFFRIKKWEEATYLFEDMPRRGCSPDTLSYRIVFDGLCEGLQFEEAAVILDEMLFKGYKPRRDRLEGFLQKLCESGKLEILSKVISSLHRGIAGDADVWSVMIPTMCKEPVISDSIDLLLNTVKEDGPLSAMPQC